jgi:colanic acid/amylovoran biosynthesis glycosyltransferase
VIPIGIDFKKFEGERRKLIEEKSIKLITVGRLDQLKGQIYGIRALSILKEKGYSVFYTIVGDGHRMKELIKVVELLNLTEDVSFEGSKTQEELFDYLCASDMFIMPSTYDDKSGRREAFGLVSLEAQASGLPVIGFNSGGFPDTIIEGETGFAVKDRDVDALASKVEYFIKNPEIYAEMSKKAIEHAASFDHQFTTQKYLDLYEEFS